MTRLIDDAQKYESQREADRFREWYIRIGLIKKWRVEYLLPISDAIDPEGRTAPVKKQVERLRKMQENGEWPN